MKAGVRKGKGPAALALWALGALGALAALVFLAGPQGAEAHPPPTGAGVQIIDTAALCGSHKLDADADNTDCDAADIADLKDAIPAVDVDSDGGYQDDQTLATVVDITGDSQPDAIVVRAGATVRLAVHVRDLSGDVPSEADTEPAEVELTATGAAFFTTWSTVGNNGGLDRDLNGTEDGLLRNGIDSQSVTAQAVSDHNGGGGPVSCDDPADTCIDGDSTNNPDGIVIFEVRSLTATDATITARSGLGSDSVRIIWVGDPATLTLTSREARLAQDINPAGPTQTAANMTFVGDPDTLLTARVTDSAGNPVSGVNVHCFIATAGRGLANIDAAPAAPPFGDDNDATDVAADTDGDDPGADTDNANTVGGVARFVLESQDNGGRGDVTVTCWADVDAGNDFDASEPSGTVTVKVVGPPASVTLTGSATMNAGESQTLTAAVSDSDGNPVADGVACAWASFGTAGGLMTPGVVSTDGGNSANTVIAANPGTILVRVVCDNDAGLGETPPTFPDANDPSRSLNITVQAAGAPGVPPAPPTQVALWPATTSQAQITFQAPAGATSYLLCTASNFNFSGETCSNVTASGNIILVPLPTADQQAVYIRLAACNSAGCSSLVFVGSLARRVPFGPNDWNFVAGTFNYLGTTFAWGQNLVSTPGKNSNFEFYRGVQGFGGTLVATCSSVAPGSSCVQSWATGGETFISVAQVFPPFPPVGVALQVQ